MKPVRTLILEDVPEDAHLLERQLKNSGIPAKTMVVDGKEEYSRTLEEFGPQVILADYRLPSFSGQEALEIRNQKGLDTPFIIVSGTIGEERAVEIMRLGASDYVMKDNLTRLGEVVKRELREAGNREKQRQDHQKLVHSEKEKKLILENTSELFVLHDPPLTIKWANKAAADSVGIELEELEGKNCHELWQHSKKPCKDCPVLRVQETLQTESVVIQAADGRFYQLHAYPIFDNEGKHISTAEFGRDITRDKLYEQELLAAKEKAEESERLKTVFLANMSHEIRTPLNGIIGFTDLLKEKGLDEERKQQFVQVIDSSAHSLLQLINDLLEFSSLEVQRVRLQPAETHLDDFIQEILDEYMIQPPQGKKHIKLIKNRGAMKKSPEVCFDPKRLRQVITNLFNNAYKFTAEGSIEFGYEITDEPMIRCYLKDSGIGIPAEAQEFIFDRFRQADEGYTRTYGGTGLGLAISKSLLEIMGGGITVESSPGKGACFKFHLPYEPSDKENLGQKDTPRVKAATDHLTEKHILVAEDVLTNYVLIESMLKGVCGRISRAVNGAEALEKVENERPDLILMDIKMPVMDGITALRKLQEKGIKIPVIALTAYAMNEEKQEIMQKGFDEYISKPFDREDLLRLMNQAVQKTV